MAAYRSLMRTVPVTAVTALAIAVTKTALILLHLLIASLLLPVSAAEAYSLSIGDGDDNSVKRFDAATGAYLGTFVAPGSGGLLGPRGLIRGLLPTVYVADLGDFAAHPGAVKQYDAEIGQFISDAAQIPLCADWCHHLEARH